jgi:stage III sporulation protein AE
MKAWIRILFSILLGFLLGWQFWGGSAYALENEDTLQELYEQSGLEDAADTLDDDVLSVLYSLGLDPKDVSTLVEMDLTQLPKAIWEMVCSQMKAPLQLTAALLGLLLLAVLWKGMQKESAAKIPADLLLCLGTAGILGASLVSLMRQLRAVIETTSGFVESFIPAYAGILAAAGQETTAYGMQTLTFGTAVFVSEWMGKIMLPCLSVYLALCLVCAAGTLVPMDQITHSISQAAGWVLGITMSLFSLVLGVQKIIAQATDSLGLKTAKFAMSSLVPVVGGALSDALSSVTTCLQLIKAAAGGFAVLALLFTYLPVLLTILSMLLTLKLAEILSALCGIDAGKRLFGAISSGIGLLLGVVLCAAAAEIIALTLLAASVG